MLNTTPYENAFNEHLRLYRQAQKDTHISDIKQHDRAIEKIYHFAKKNGYQLNGDEQEGFVFEPDPERK